MKFEWKNAFKIGLSIFILYIAIHYWEDLRGWVEALFNASLPLVAGAIIAYFVNILMSFYERHWFKKTKKKWIISIGRPVCMVGAFVTLAAIVVIVTGMVLPEFISCIKLIISKIPTAMNFIISKTEQLKFLPQDYLNILNEIDWQSRVNDLLKVFGTGVSNVMDVVVVFITSVVSALVKSVVALIFAIYLLLSKDKLKIQFARLMDRYLKSSLGIKIRYATKVFDECFHRYIVGQCIEAVVLGVLCSLGMMVLRLPYATMIGALMAVTALVPVAGAYIGAGIGAFMLLTVSPVKALIFLVFIIILQQIEGNVIYPKVVGSSLGLPGLWVLAAVTIGGGVMGIVGMLLGVPIAAAIYKIVRDDMNKKIPGKNYNKVQKKNISQ